MLWRQVRDLEALSQRAPPDTSHRQMFGLEVRLVKRSEKNLIQRYKIDTDGVEELPAGELTDLPNENSADECVTEEECVVLTHSATVVEVKNSSHGGVSVSFAQPLLPPSPHPNATPADAVVEEEVCAPAEERPPPPPPPQEEVPSTQPANVDWKAERQCLAELAIRLNELQVQDDAMEAKIQAACEADNFDRAEELENERVRIVEDLEKVRCEHAARLLEESGCVQPAVDETGSPGHVLPEEVRIDGTEEAITGHVVDVTGVVPVVCEDAAEAPVGAAEAPGASVTEAQEVSDVPVIAVASDLAEDSDAPALSGSLFNFINSGASGETDDAKDGAMGEEGIVNGSLSSQPVETFVVSATPAETASPQVPDGQAFGGSAFSFLNCGGGDGGGDGGGGGIGGDTVNGSLAATSGDEDGDDRSSLHRDAAGLADAAGDTSGLAGVTLAGAAVNGDRTALPTEVASLAVAAAITSGPMEDAPSGEAGNGYSIALSAEAADPATVAAATSGPAEAPVAAAVPVEAQEQCNGAPPDEAS